jgi:Subtilase family
MNVHIISMSWTIPGSHSCLDQAVDKANRANIIMFGSASDQGAHITEKPYMAKCSKHGVICIGGARETSYGDDRTKPEADFFFPGETQGIPQPLPYMKSSFSSKFGSSVATALASGLTALIMHLVELSEDSRVNYRMRLQDHENIRAIFKGMIASTQPINLRGDCVIPVTKFFNPTWGESMPGWGEKQVKRKLDLCVKNILR